MCKRLHRDGYVSVLTSFAAADSILFMMTTLLRRPSGRMTGLRTLDISAATDDDDDVDDDDDGDDDDDVSELGGFHVGKPESLPNPPKTSRTLCSCLCCLCSQVVLSDVTQWTCVAE